MLLTFCCRGEAAQTGASFPPELLTAGQKLAEFPRPACCSAAQVGLRFAASQPDKQDLDFFGAEEFDATLHEADHSR